MLKRKEKKKNYYMALKLDTNKAFDNLKWYFLIQLLKVFGFHQKRIDFIMSCVTTISYKIKINDVLGDCFKP